MNSKFAILPVTYHSLTRRLILAFVGTASLALAISAIGPPRAISQTNVGPGLRTASTRTTESAGPANVDFPGPEAAPNEPFSPAEREPIDANQLVLRAAQQLTTHHSISARLRQRIDLFGQQLLGTGEFWQLNLGGTTYVRYEIKIPVGDQLASVQQVNDGRFLWIRRSVPTPGDATRLHTTLRRIDVQTVTKAFESLPANSPLRELAVNAGHGGLAELLVDLYRHFDFQTAYRGNLHGVPVWITTGTAIPPQGDGPMHDPSAAGREKKDPATSSMIATTPAQQPDAVTIAIGQDDAFPYRVEFHKHKEDITKSPNIIVNKNETQSILLLELFEVTLDGPLDPRRIFVYHPDEVQLVDVTQSYIDRLQQTVR